MQVQLEDIEDSKHSSLCALALNGDRKGVQLFFEGEKQQLKKAIVRKYFVIISMIKAK